MPSSSVDQPACSSKRLSQAESLIPTDGETISGKQRNTEGYLGTLVETTSWLSEEQIQKALLDYINGSQSQFFSPSTNRSSEWIGMSGFLPVGNQSPKIEQNPEEFERRLIKLVGLPQTSKSRNTTDFLNYLVRVSIDEKDEKYLQRSILKHEETHSTHSGDLKGAKSVEFGSKREVYSYTPDREQSWRSSLRPRKSSSGTSSISQMSRRRYRKGFFAPCCCCCDETKSSNPSLLSETPQMK